MNAIIDALRAKYRTPADVMRSLGLDASLLNSRDRATEYLKPLKPARDISRETLSGERDDEEIATDDPAERLHALLRDKLSEEELKAVGEILLEMAQGEEAEEDEDEARADGDEREGMRDHDDFEEDEEPEPEERARSKDAALGARRGVKGVRRAGAMDEAAALAFDARYPALARVSVDTSIVPLRHDGSIQNVTPRKSSDASASFAARFPALKRLVA